MLSWRRIAPSCEKVGDPALPSSAQRFGDWVSGNSFTSTTCNALPDGCGSTSVRPDGESVTKEEPKLMFLIEIDGFAPLKLIKRPASWQSEISSESPAEVNWAEQQWKSGLGMRRSSSKNCGKTLLKR